MSVLHFTGQFDYDIVEQTDGYLGVARAACLKLEDGYRSKTETFQSRTTADDEREASASAIEEAARQAMTWCERQNTGALQ